jgi:hypothetical protein
MINRASAAILFSIAVGVMCLSPTHILAKKGGADRPFKGNAQGSIVGGSGLPDDPLVVEYTGNATHLGKFTRTERATLDGMGGVSGTIDYVAANGDELFTTFIGVFVDLGIVEGTYTVEGGTGRFAGASGGADFTATTDFVTVNATFSGEISY